MSHSSTVPSIKRGLAKANASTSELTLERNDTDLESSVGSIRDASETSQETRQNQRQNGSRPFQNSGPKWNYGSIAPPLTPSSSGLSLSNRGYISTVQPEVLQDQLIPLSDGLRNSILDARDEVSSILSHDINDDSVAPLLVVAGPTYVTNPDQIRACAKWIENRSSLTDSLVLGLRANLTKYNFDVHDAAFDRTTDSIMTYEIHQGIPSCRTLLRDLAETCPIVGEISDTLTPQYLSDLYSLAMVSSTFVESQLHRELVSGTSFAVGFGSQDSNLPFDKDMYVHKVGSAMDALYAASQQHQFLSVTKIGTVAVVGTVGNDETFVVLQVNSELSLNDLNALIAKVYNSPYMKYQKPKILLDLGRVSDSEFEGKSTLLQALLAQTETRAKIIGVMIDSGDHYDSEANEYLKNADKLISQLSN